MRLRKLLAILLTLSMLISMVPLTGVVKATDGESGVKTDAPAVINPNNLFLDKTATLTDDGTYTINLGVYATGSPITTTVLEGEPLDVVLVIDQSGSLHESGSLPTLKSSVTSFVEELKANGEAFGVNHRIAICGFASNEKDGTSGIEEEGYTYAGSDHDNAWVNTGLFVDGAFKDYASMEYIQVEKVEDISTSKFYSVKCDPDGDGNFEIQRTYMLSGKWCVYLGTTGSHKVIAEATTDEEGNGITATQNLFNNYEVYTLGNSANQLTAADYAASWEYISDGAGNLNADVTKTIDSLAANGATRIHYGLKMAARMLANVPVDGVERKKVVIVFTDGKPGYSGENPGDMDAALSEAKKIKENGVEIYTVGVYNASDAAIVDSFMNQLSSNYSSHAFSEEPSTLTNVHNYNNGVGIDGSRAISIPYFHKVENEDGTADYWPIRVSYEYGIAYYHYWYITDTGETLLYEGKNASMEGLYTLSSTVSDDPDADYYRYSSDIVDLPDIFHDVVTDATTYIAKTELDANAVLKDVLADGFKLTDNTTITVSVVPGSVSEANKDIAEEKLTSDKITWGEAQQVLTFAYPTATTGKGTVTVDAETTMTLTAKAGEDGVVAVTGFDYANQYIGYGHPGSKLVVTITGVEAALGVTTDAKVDTNHGTSGIYESAASDADEDGITGEMQASFPIPTTHLTSKTYQLDYTRTITIDPKDFLMTNGGVNVDVDGYNYFGEPGTTVETEFGEVTVNADGTITYTLTENNWINPDTFYLFGTTDDSTVTGATANANGNMWSKITIVPPADIRGNLFVDKTATLTGNGTYTINLEGYATGTPTDTVIKEGLPLDVVLVIDQSGSLHANGGTYDGVPLQMLKESVSEFVETLKANGEAFGVNHRISMCGFGSGELQGPSGTTKGGFSYAGDNWDTAWINTGLFVNGEFRDYATMNYIRITDPAELDENRNYTVKLPPNEQGISEYVKGFYYNGYTAWRYSIGYIGEMLVNGDTVEENNRLLVEQFEVYKSGKSTVQLHDEDYAASWENLASGANGQGSINPDILKSIDSLAANGATNTFYGLKMASRMLENAPDDGVQRKKVVIVFTDGEPGYGGFVKGDADAALAEVMKIKENGAEVYAVGVYSAASEAKVNTFMNHLSSNYSGHSFTTTPTRIDMSQVKTNTTGNTRLASNINNGKNGISPYFVKVGDEYWPVAISTNYENPEVYYASYITDRAEAGGVLLGYGAWEEIPGIVGDVYMLAEPEKNDDPYANYYRYSSDVAEMPDIFQNVVSDATSYSTRVELGADAILKDVLADGFKLTDKTTITVSVVPGSVSEANKNIPADELTSDKITWGTAQQVLTFNYSEAKEGTGKVVVNGAADQTQMTITAKVDENGVITVTGFNYSDAEDKDKNNAQYIAADHAGSKLVVTVTGVEAVKDIVTDFTTVTNKGSSGIYEGPERDADSDGEKGEMQASFPIPTTHLTSKTYYLDYTGKITIDPKDFLMTNGGVNADIDGYHFFDTAAPGTTVETEYGRITVNEDGTITYELIGADWEHDDVFYLFGTTTNSTITGATANANGNMWSKITIVPPADIRGSLFLDKTATLTGNGSYTIDLEAYATGTPVDTSFSDGLPLDVVLVIDQSGSLHSGEYGGSLSVLKESVTEFVKTLKANGAAYGVDHRISVCGFASRAKQGVSGLSTNGYTFAGTNTDNAWVNTGLFVNGEFMDYATVNYTRITSPDQINNSKYYTAVFDADGDGITEYARLSYHTGYAAWRYLDTNNKYQILVKGTSKETANALLLGLENCEIYDFGESTLQLDDADYAASWENVASGANGQGSINSDILKTIDNLAANGATATFYGLKMASQMLENAPDDGIQRKKVVIVFTDGEPGYSGYVRGDGDAALSEVMKIKETGAEVYAVGVYGSAAEGRVNTFMNQLSSNYQSHSFATEPTRIDVSQIKTSDTSGTTDLRQEVADGYSGLSPYYKKVGENYWPVLISWKSADSLYYVSYITDTGEVMIASGAKAELPDKVGDVYMLTEHEINENRNKDYYKYSSDIDELREIFQQVAAEATSYRTQVSLGADAILKDVLSDGFKLTDNTTITVSVVPGSVSEANKNIPADKLTSDKITWGVAQQVLTFNYSEAKEGTGKVVVNGAADQTEMTITAKVDANGVISVTGYNYTDAKDNNKNDAQYIRADHPGSKLVVTITGLEAVENIVTGSTTVTNKGTSGIYEGPESDLDGDGEKGEMQASFPIPTTHLTSKVYVVDYARPLVIDPADFLMAFGEISLDVDGYNYFGSAITVISEKYGKVEVKDGKIIYTPTKTNWDGFDTFYVFGTTNDATVKAATANANGNMWAKIKVIPANNVYYEDTFVSKENSDTAGIIYNGSWKEEETDNDQKENAESNETATNGGVHGWEDTLADDNDYSAGSAHMSDTVGATATFTFTGTGVDIYSRTNETTGIVVALLYKGTSTTDENGKNLMAEKALMVDNLAASGDYYQVPTLSLCGLDFGTYTVKIVVSKASASQTGAERFIYYLDGIRVYNPIQNLEGDETVSGAYGESEMNANFVEIRDKLLDANSFSAQDDDSTGPVFIDRITDEEGNHTDNTETWEVGEYKVFGPENEVYLSADPLQMIAFAVEYREGAHYYIGMKSLTGEPISAILSTPNNEMEIISISHTTDLYYEVAPAWEYDEDGNPTIGIISVMTDLAMDENGEYIMDENGDFPYEGSILALTKLKVTGPDAKGFKFAKVSKSTLLSHANSITTDADVPDADTPDTDAPDAGVPDAGAPDAGKPEDTEPAGPDVDIDNPEPEQPELDPQDIAKKRMKEMLKKIFAHLGSWFGN